MSIILYNSDFYKKNINSDERFQILINEINDTIKIDNYYKKLIANIDKAFENIKANKYNLQSFIKEVPKIYDSISKNKNLSVDEKREAMINKSEEINNLMKKYDDVIKLGELKETRLENIKLNKDNKNLENIREL